MVGVGGVLGGHGGARRFRMAHVMKMGMMILMMMRSRMKGTKTSMMRRRRRMLMWSLMLCWAEIGRDGVRNIFSYSVSRLDLKMVFRRFRRDALG